MSNNHVAKVSFKFSKRMMRLAVGAIVLSGVVKEDTDDYRYYVDYLRTGNRMFSDGMLGKALVECHKSISENKVNSCDVNNNIFQDFEKVSFELAISKSRGFTQDDREYVNNNFEGKTFSKKVRNLITDVLKLTYSNLSPSTCTTSCGAKYSISQYMNLSKLENINFVHDPCARTSSLLLEAKKQIPNAHLFYNDTSREYYRYIKVLSSHPYQLIEAIISLRQHYFGEYDLKKVCSNYRKSKRKE